MRPVETTIFRWQVDAAGAGQRELHLLIQLAWAPDDPANPGPQDLVDYYFVINVEKHLFTLGQIQIGTLLTGFLGSAFTAPFAFHLWQEAKRHSGKKRETID